MPFIRKRSIAAVMAGAALITAVPGSAEERDDAPKPEAQEVVHGAPSVASEPWMIAAGGRI